MTRPWSTRRSPTRLSRLTVVAVVVPVTALLGSCGGASGPPPTGTATTSSGAAVLPAIAHLSAITCTTDAKHRWSFRTTVTDRDSVKTTYVVTASVVQKKDGKVMGRKQLSATLGPGASTTLSAPEFFTGDPKSLVCVPSVTTTRT